eukprot:CAMPEP_0197657638 /NCGR_PEP_ID=MMETSP1338-20131121/44752_1 /TAXON_ID=43686 ORGANISM="Pelagodinium beii, Strain RCC1491" /NCGR_SAMPLE_ID=MMETSP1338 /ASSEMBLY_ACC=CAM_ASM_000754 /LENGTH=95 /DNA_ID=CAMNT_0043234053 /DNA_START=73 /DNA_END=360 /DNA_ORIENTATION=+
MKLQLFAFLVLVFSAEGRLGEGAQSELSVQAEAQAPLHGLSGEACTADEYKRYKTIVCDLKEACGCSETLCAQDWCNDYMRKWKKEFGACTLQGC